VSRTRYTKVLKRRLIEGLIVIVPVTATGFILWWIFQLLDGLLGRWLYPALTPYIPWITRVPGLGLLALLLVLLGVGWVAEWAVGSRMIAWWHSLLERIPATRRIYGAANRVVRTVLTKESGPFTGVVLVEWPSPGRWTIGFLSARAPEAVQAHIADPVSVFIMKMPHPASGFVVIMPRSKVTPLEMSVDEGITYILTAGSVTPEGERSTMPADWRARPSPGSTGTESRALP
jgi:uncharacterized membrane protein